MTNEEAQRILTEIVMPPIRKDGKSQAHYLALEAIGVALEALSRKPIECVECRYAETFVFHGEVGLTCYNNEGLFRDVPTDGYCYCGEKMENDDGRD